MDSVQQTQPLLGKRLKFSQTVRHGENMGNQRIVAPARNKVLLLTARWLNTPHLSAIQPHTMTGFADAQVSPLGTALLRRLSLTTTPTKRFLRDCVSRWIIGPRSSATNSTDAPTKPGRWACCPNLDQPSTQLTMKSLNKIKFICGGLATVRKIRGQNSALVSFHKNWGHGKLGGDATQGTLGKLAAAGFEVSRGNFGNEYTIKLD